MCPQWRWLQIAHWLVPQKARRRACDHDPVICTRPDALRGCWLANRKPMPELLFATVRATLVELLGDELYLGARPGMMAALRTWRQTLGFHPQLHCVVTGGG